jgi:D-alanyl-D-alanine carboxypeptidase
MKNPAIEISPMILVRVGAALPPLFRPGSEYHYSNTGFLVLGLVASRATGETLPALLPGAHLRPPAPAPDGLGSARADHGSPRQRLQPAHRWDVDRRHLPARRQGRRRRDRLERTRDGALPDRTDAWGAGARAPARRHESGGLWTGGDRTGCGGAAFGHGGAGAGFKSNAWVSGDGKRVAVLLLNGRRDDGTTDVQSGNLMATIYCLPARGGRG